MEKGRELTEVEAVEGKLLSNLLTSRLVLLGHEVITVGVVRDYFFEHRSEGVSVIISLVFSVQSIGPVKAGLFLFSVSHHMEMMDRKNFEKKKKK